MNFFKSFFVYLTSSIFFIFIIIKHFSIFKFRLKGQDAVTILEKVKKEGREFIIHEEIVFGILPNTYTALCYLDKMFMFFKIEERILRTGKDSTDIVANVIIFRWNRKKIRNIINESRKTKEEVHIYVIHAWDSIKTGSFKIPDKIEKPYIDNKIREKVEKDAKRVISGSLNKVGTILYGDPGNGKSFFIRYIALKYKLPIYIMSLMPDLDNYCIIKMFSYASGPAVVLLEDFDKYFDKTKCLLSNPRFTFDTLLNVLDGSFSNLNKLLFFMTANDINKIDVSLKSRPGRFKHIIEVKNPNNSIRNEILSKFNLDGELNTAVALTNDFTLDMLLSIEDRFKNNNKSILDIISETRKEYKEF